MEAVEVTGRVSRFKLRATGTRSSRVRAVTSPADALSLRRQPCLIRLILSSSWPGCEESVSLKHVWICHLK